MRKHLICLLVAVLGFTLFSCKTTPAASVLVFSKTAGYRHEAIEAGKEALKKMGLEKNIDVTFSEDSNIFNERDLKQFRAVIFLNTTGDILNEEQQNSFERFIQAGGGYVGIHAATDTEYDWPWYGKLAGAWFLDHPMDPSNVQKGRFLVTKKNHWATQGMPDTFEREDEFYSFKNISPDIEVVLEIDETSYEGGKNPDYHPMSWYQEFDGGRSFYTAMGHTDETYTEDLVLRHLWAGIDYVLGGENPKPLNYALARPEENRFTKVILADKLDEPMELAVLDENRILFIQRKGEVRLFDIANDELKTIAKLPVNLKYINNAGEESVAEDGLLGMNIDPNFSTNNWIYLYYSTPKESANYLSRFVLKGDELDLDSEKIILKIPTQREECCHTGGSIAWDSDGNLFLSTGDNTNPHGSDGYSPSDERKGRSAWDAQKSSANTNDLRGKILRIKPHEDGTYSIPDGNLFEKGMEKARPEIYTMGHRNPFRISVDSHNGFLYWGEVGPDSSEPDSLRGPAGHDEIGQARSAGNFGWPHFVGNNKAYNKYDFEKEESLEKWNANAPVNTSPNNTGLEKLPPAQDAFIWYPYGESKEFPLVGSGGRNAMAGPVFYKEDFERAERAFPEYYDGKLLVYEWMRGWIMAVTMDEDGNYKSMERFMPSYRFSNPMDMQFAANGDLYMLEYGSGWFTANDDARLVRIEYNGGNRTPKIQVAANKMGGALPFQLELNADNTTDPDSDELEFKWEISSDNGFKETFETPNPSVTLNEIGIYKAKLTVSDGHGGTASQTMEIVAGNEPPNLSMDMPKGNRSFFVPNTLLDYVIEVSDKEDGTLKDGIEPAEVSVSFDYLPEGYDKITIAQGHRSADESAQYATGKALIEGSDCRACHKQLEKSIGPSYKEVALKYKGDETAIEHLSNKIISGGGGVWGETPMAAHPQITTEEAADISRYILSLANENRTQNTLPTSGAYPTIIPSGDPGKGTYIVRASYQDKGANNMPSMGSEESFLLRSTILDAHGMDEYVDVSKMAFGGANFAIGTRSGAYMKLNQIHLDGLKSLKISASAPISQLSCIGGKVELHVGSPDGTLIGESEFLEASDTRGNIIEAPINLPMEFSGSKQDLYIVFTNDTSGKGGTIMVVSGLEFTMISTPEPAPIQVVDNGSASVGNSFFSGKWKLTFKGTPNGDTEMVATIMNKGGVLSGSVQDIKGENDAIPLEDIKESSSGIEFTFITQGFNVKVELEKVDKANLVGKMMGMFDALAVRL
ncbi:ThuA domain-containing protein [Maribacter flavus]|uniref:C-type cytochrome n=1 Tax=Maribacter flavus TaxID=1658664 RepID=A0A5B2TP97_9FLAO|nr:ThuA domain-containing protein [Maribacter flavus]KAA2215765.1 c-type cytochrome [Maribacter flavus]